MAERAGVLRIGDRVVFAGAERSVVALSGSLVRLMADSGETTVVAMAYLAGAPDFAVVGAGPSARISPEGLLESLPAKVVEAAREWERHLTEMETGLPLGAAPGTRPRPEYDPVASPCSSGREPRRPSWARACARCSGCGGATWTRGCGGWRHAAREAGQAHRARRPEGGGRGRRGDRRADARLDRKRHVRRDARPADRRPVHQP